MVTMMRRAGLTDDEEQLETLYEGLRPAYKRYVRRDDVHTLAELGTRAFEFEDIEEAEREDQTNQRQISPRDTAAAATYKREECCWRCKQRGHIKANCQRPPRKFCSFCGRDGVLTRDCHPSTGNFPRAGADPTAPRPPTESE